MQWDALSQLVLTLKTAKYGHYSDEYIDNYSIIEADFKYIRAQIPYPGEQTSGEVLSGEQMAYGGR